MLDRQAGPRRAALEAVRTGDALVVPRLDRLACSVPDARAIADEMARRDARLQLGASVHDPHSLMGRMFFDVLATSAEFEADLIRLRTREGMAVARAKGHLKGRVGRVGRPIEATRPALQAAASHGLDVAGKRA